ncbi:MAG: serine/threonine-protein kinase [Candidatus Bathyarchaeota archaeon]|nr:serine/threonine-protein kinase [Candidatus Termiticorpusculum sp.]
MKDFETGAKIPLELSGDATIISRLGSGGQGTVYKVSLNDKEYALKWYHPNGIKNHEKFRKNLRTNIKKGTPDKKFLWPLYLTEKQAESFGYIMELRPKDFSDFADILNAKDKDGNKLIFSDLRSMINAALNIVNGFRQLHRKGLSYQDLNDGNFFINVNTGDVLICDNDNVAPDQESFGIGGKPGYMAPEVVRGSVKPHAVTDYHSLAVILFKLLIRHDPLMGTNYVNSVCITEKKELELYGTNPIFIFDPQDFSNRPYAGVHNNPIKLWPKYPKYLQDAFIQSFSEGMKNPDKRLPENEWQKLLIQLRDDLIVCSCGAPIFIGNANFDSNNIAVCVSCGRKFSKPMKLKIKTFEVNMFPKNKLYKCHTVDNMEGSDDYMTETGEVIQNKNNPSIWGIRNTSEDTWLMKTPDGTTISIPPNAVVPIVDNVEVTFTNILGRIQK